VLVVAGASGTQLPDDVEGSWSAKPSEASPFSDSEVDEPVEEPAFRLPDAASSTLALNDKAAIRGALYMDTTDESKVSAVLYALRDLWAAFDVEETEFGEPQWGSFFQPFRLIFSRRKAVTRMLEAVAAQYQGIPQAEADTRSSEAISQLLEQVRDPEVPNIAIYHRDQLLLKHTDSTGRSQVVVTSLTSRQVARLEANIGWLSDPQRLLVELSAIDAHATELAGSALGTVELGRSATEP
jgi:hypothetical protein